MSDPIAYVQHRVAFALHQRPSTLDDWSIDELVHCVAYMEMSDGRES